jgi:outer membrane biogenesis lipoprotein LolB
MIIAAVCLLTGCCTTSRRPDATLYPEKAAFKEEQFLEKLRDARTLAHVGNRGDDA